MLHATCGRPSFAAHLLAAYGRVGQVRPAVTGKVVVYGRKPWLGFKFSKLVVAP